MKLLYVIYNKNFTKALPHIAFSVCSLTNDNKSFTTVPSTPFKDFVMHSPSLIKISTNWFNILKWSVGVNIFRRVCHLTPITKTR